MIFSLLGRVCGEVSDVSLLRTQCNSHEPLVWGVTNQAGTAFKSTGYFFPTKIFKQGYELCIIEVLYRIR